MSRFQGDSYEEEYPNQALMWQWNLEQHLKGAKGQAVLRELREALLELPERRLIRGRLADEDGCVCVVGALAVHRGFDIQLLAEKIKPDPRWGDIDEYDSELATQALGHELGLKDVMAMALAAHNDDAWSAPINETLEQRFERVLAWVEKALDAVPA